MDSFPLFVVISAFLLTCDGSGYTGPSNGDIRLLDIVTSERNMTSGVLEMYLTANDTWGVVCVKKLDMNFASTTCQQLGYTEATSFSPVDNDTIYDMRDILLKNVRCNQAYLHILQCDYTFNTDTMEDACEEGNSVAHITCRNTTLVSSNQEYMGQLGLFYGEWSSRGLLKVYLNDKWGTVCDEFYTQSVADVTCRQLGYTNAVYYGKYPQNEVRFIWLRKLNCSRNNASCLKNCYSAPAIRNIYCSNRDDVFVVCTFDPAKYNPQPSIGIACQLEYKRLPVGVVAILMILFCVIVLVYIVIFTARVCLAAYHNTGNYRQKDGKRNRSNHHHTKLDSNSLIENDSTTDE